MYAENYKTLIKEIEDDSKYGQISHAVGLEELILFKWPYYKQSTNLIGFLSNLPMTFYETRINSLKTYMEP